MTNLNARIEAALATGLTKDGFAFTAEDAQKAHKAIREPMIYGNNMTPRRRDSILTHRFGI